MRSLKSLKHPLRSEYQAETDFSRGYGMVFYDVDDIDIYDPFYKIRRFINHIVSTPLRLYDLKKYAIKTNKIRFQGMYDE